MSAFEMAWRIALFAGAFALGGTYEGSKAVAPSVIVGVVALLLDRRLRDTTSASVSLLATLALLIALPVPPVTSAANPDPVLLFSVGSLAFLWLTWRESGRAFKAFVGFTLALAPALYAALRSFWWDVNLWNVMVGLFGARGVFYSAPLLWAGLGGVIGLARERPALGRVCALALLGGFAGMAFDTEGAGSSPLAAIALPFFLPGIAWTFNWLRDRSSRAPERAVMVAGGLLVAWNLLFMEQYRRRLLPSDDTVSFARVTSNSAAIFARRFGAPNAWPASWLFAKRFDAPADTWDAVAGRRLFATAASTSATIEIGDDLSVFAPDKALMLEGFKTRRTCGQGWCRDLDGSGRILIPLQNPGLGSFVVTLRVRGEGSLSLSMDGRATTVTELSSDLSDVVLRVPADSIDAGFHVLTVSISKDGRATLDRLTLLRDLGTESAT